MKKLSDISEKTLLRGEKEKTAVITFGRFQPPTTGHAKLVDAVVSVSKKLGADAFVFPSRTQDSKKNPLSPKDKIKWMKKFFPGVKIVDDRNAVTVFKAIESLINKGYTSITLVVGGDRVDEFEKTIRPYVNNPDPKKSLNLDNFEVVSAGERDPDAEDVTGMSASKMRDAVSRNSFSEFLNGIPKHVSDRFASELFDLLRKNMGLREETEVKEKKKKTILVVSEKSKGSTVKKILEVCEELGHEYYFIKSNTAYVGDIDEDTITIENIDGKGKDIQIDASNTIAFVRGSATKTAGGKALLEGLSDKDLIMINSPQAMELAGNKFSSFVLFDRAGIKTPRTALITNEASIEKAHKRIGGKFPVILKTLHGAEGIGVMKVDSEDSFRSIVQSMRKEGQDILAQEMIEMDGDVRTIVMDGKIVASLKRKKLKNDFRSNRSLGAETEPYSLSEKEKKVVLKAARQSGAVLVGVDHALTAEGDIYVIEMNTSPGSDADAYMKYENNEAVSGGDELYDGRKLTKRIVEMALDVERPRKTFEMGRVENIMVEGQEMKARIDSGNSSYSVVDARGIKENGDKVSFTFGSKRYTKPIVDRVNINIGKGQIEERPVVEMTARIGNRDFRNVRFSLADRTSNVYPILLGNKFMRENNIVIHTDRAFMRNIDESKEVSNEIDKFTKEFFKKRKATEVGIDFSNPPEEATDEIVNRYKKMTPGELNELAYEFFGKE